MAALEYRGSDSSNARPPRDPGGPQDPFHVHLVALERRGFAVIPEFISSAEVEELRFEMDALQAAGGFHKAGVGQGTDHTIEPGVRTDSICWIEQENATPVQKKYINKLTDVRDRIRDYFRLPLSEAEYYYAIYPPGGYYRRHYDNFAGESRRLITALLYLNQGWQVSDGGELCIYPPAKNHRILFPGWSAESQSVRVIPESGTLALFLSVYMPHSVTRAGRERRSMGVWFGSARDPERLVR